MVKLNKSEPKKPIDSIYKSRNLMVKLNQKKELLLESDLQK